MSFPFEVLRDYERRASDRVLPVAEKEEDLDENWRGIGYRLGNRHLVSLFKEVVEITRLQPITTVLGAKPWIAGLCNLNGELYPVIDLAAFMEDKPANVQEGQRVLVMERTRGERDVILAVDEILGHRSFDKNTDEPPSDMFSGRYADFVDCMFQDKNEEWGVFSLTRLSEHITFQQASAL